MAMENDKYFNNFINYLRIEKRLSSNTIFNYSLDIKKFYKFFNNKIDNLTKENIDKYIKSLNNNDASSINRNITSIRQFLKFLIKNNIYEEKILDNLEYRKTPKKLPKFLTIEEIDRLLNIKLNTSFDYRNKAMFELMYSTGLRITELISLTLNSIDLENCMLRTMGKGKKERIIPIGDEAIKWVKLYINEHRNSLIKKKNKVTDILFLNNHGKILSRSGFNMILKAIASENKIDKYLTPHVIRHSFATHLVENGADIRVVQELLGHENIETTEIYTHISNKYIIDNYRNCHPRSKKE